MDFFKQTTFLITLFACFTFISCAQDVPTAKAAVTQEASSSDNYLFTVGKRGNGTAFYAMDSNTGALSYMLDYGEGSGKWLSYGNTIRETAGNPLLFDVVEGAKGTTIYAMDSGTGQLYYMLDHGNMPGQWAKFGGRIRENALNMLQFKLVDRTGGNVTFFAYDSFKHKTFYMNLSGSQAGRWNNYGDK